MIETVDANVIRQLKPCPMSIDWFNAQTETNSVLILRSFILQKRYEWAKWFIVRVMDYPHYTNLALFAANEVKPVYDGRFSDTFFQNTIESSQRYLLNRNEPNRRDTRIVAQNSKGAAINSRIPGDVEARAALWSATGAALAIADFSWSADWLSKDFGANFNENNGPSFWAAEWAISWAISTTQDAILKERLFKKILDYGMSLLP